MKNAYLLAAATAVSLALAVPAQAQKSKDTLRLAVTEPIRYVEGLFNAGVEGFILDRMVQDNLLYYDTVEQKLKPQLATEWKRIDNKTIEFKLRQGVKFHDGTEFDADDVVYTIQTALDPKYQFRLKERYNYISGVEKIDKYTVRVHVYEGSGVDLINLANQPPMLPSRLHAKLADANKVDFGRATVGTGPYKLTSLETNGITLEKAETYNWDGSQPAGKIGRIAVSAIGDKQTQIAKVYTDELDMIFQVDLDQAKDVVAKKPNYKIYVSPTVNFVYVNFDAANRSGNSPFTDKRVREAVLASLDRKALRAAFLPEEMKNEPVLESMCHPWLVPCHPTTPMPAYDPEHARQLLKDAGYPNGLDVEITTWAPPKAIAEAVAGEMRKVGIRATVNAPTVSVFQKLRADGKVQMFVTIWDNSGGQPDIDATAKYYYSDTPQNYTRDPVLADWTKDARVELDPAKREEIYNKLFNRVAEERYTAAVVQFPSIVVQSQDLIFEDARILYTQGFALNRISWAK